MTKGEPQKKQKEASDLVKQLAVLTPEELLRNYINAKTDSAGIDSLPTYIMHAFYDLTNWINEYNHNRLAEKPAPKKKGRTKRRTPGK